MSRLRRTGPPGRMVGLHCHLTCRFRCPGRESDSLDAQFHAEANSDDPDPVVLAELIWQRLDTMERVIHQIAWFVVDDKELPRNLANLR